MSRNWYSKLVNKSIQKNSSYNTFLVNLFINKLQKQGKKRVAEALFYKTLKKIKSMLKVPPLLVLEVAIRKLLRFFKFKKLKLNSGRYIKKIKCTPYKSIKLAISQIILNTRNNLKKRNISDNLAHNLIKIAVKRRKRKRYNIYKNRKNKFFKIKHRNRKKVIKLIKNSL